MRTRMLGALSATALVLVTLAAAGCGSSGGAYANANRPPAPVTISIAIAGVRVAVSPSHVGAGPVLLLISNQDDRTHDLVLRAAGGGGGCVADGASSGPINPQDVAQLKLPLVEGTCEVAVADGGLRAARLTVGRERPTAQQDLLQP